MFQAWEGERKLCSEFKFSYIGNTDRENFYSVLSFLYRGDFSIMHIYANRNVLSGKVLVA